MRLEQQYDPFRITDKTALVTGAGSGIGEAIAHQLTSAGASVIVSDLDEKAAQRVAASLPGSVPLRLDVTSEADLTDAAEALGKLDILVNNAGIGFVGGIAQTPYTEFSRVMSVNCDSVYLVTRAFLPHLLRSSGKVINIASVAGVVGVKERFAYCASKGAVIAMTRQLAADYPTQLRVNCICPGTVDSPFVAGYLARFHAGQEEATRERLKARQPVGRLGQPAEVAALVRYLCAPAADFMQGSVLMLDGGWTAL